MGKYYEFAKFSVAVSEGLVYTISGTVTRGLYKEGDKLPEGTKIGDRKRIMIVFRKGHKGAAYRTYDVDNAVEMVERDGKEIPQPAGDVLEFIKKNSKISDADWKSRVKTTDSTPVPMMTAQDLGIVTETTEEVNEETDEDQEVNLEDDSDETLIIDEDDELVNEEEEELVD